MVIKLGEAQVLKRQVPKPGYRFVGRNPFCAYIREQCAQQMGIHAAQINICGS